MRYCSEEAVGTLLGERMEGQHVLGGQRHPAVRAGWCAAELPEVVKDERPGDMRGSRERMLKGKEKDAGEKGYRYLQQASPLWRRRGGGL
jgi:hypothetical protein